MRTRPCSAGPACLSKARPGTVLICQPNDSTVAHMGELSAETLKLKGVRGYVADGGCRDVDFILKLGFPVWCRYFTPRDIVGYWLPQDFDQPIRIGEVTIRAGDLVLGDRDGMVILPQDRAERDRRRGRGRDRHREPDPQGDPRGRRPAGGLPEVRQVLSRTERDGEASRPH